MGSKFFCVFCNMCGVEIEMYCPCLIIVIIKARAMEISCQIIASWCFLQVVDNKMSR